MVRIRGGAIVLGLSLAFLLGGGIARAQEVTGKIIGRVIDKDNGQPLSGVTVIVQGPQGDDSSVTDDSGNYYFSTLPAGTYVIRFYVANSPTKTEQSGVVVTADKTVRVNARIAGQAAAAAAEQTYVITRRPSAIDVGSTRLGPTFDNNFTTNVPVGRNFGDIIEKAPGAFVDRTGSVSIAGATGLENIYLVDGLNVTGTEFGNINSNAATLGGGSNFPVEFLDQVSVNTGGYNAEFGGAMGGVINAVTKSGTNDLHGSAFGYWSPYFLSADPNVIDRKGGAISFQRKPDFDTSVGVEVGGPILKNKLFFWVGFAPRVAETHVFRITRPLLLQPDGSTVSGDEVDRRRLDEPTHSYHYGAKLDFVPAPEHRLTLSLFGSPSSSEGMRSFLGVEAISDPTWARETQVRDTTDVSARWVSKLFDRKWQIEADFGLHREYYNNYSPTPALNSLNQQEWWGANLWDLEHTPGCEPSASGYQPCPVDNYHNGGFGLEKKYDANRWGWDLKSTHIFEAGGHHELKYGWHGELTQFNQDRYYSGPIGDRAVIMHFLPPTYSPPYIRVQNFFSLPNGVQPYQVVNRGFDLQVSPAYQDHLKADVKNFINSLFLQDSYSPLSNVTFNVGARYEMQNMYDFHGAEFLSLRSIAPRIGVAYDPTNDGRSKVFAHYGQYSETIPMSLASRYFGGEGIIVAQVDPATCTNPPNNWTGNGHTEFRTCAQQPASNYFAFNNGSNYPVQPNLKSQYHNEVVAGVQREVMEDLVLGLNYTRRWLGAIIEDGTAYDGTFLLANPGAVPPEALAAYQSQVDRYTAQVSQHQMEVASATTDDARNNAQAALTNSQNQLASSQSLLGNLKGLAVEPKPERTYNALTLFADKRFSKQWLVHASYTYSRLVGNYEGLYQDHQDYFAPNGGNTYDTPDQTYNARGPLPNDHPHSGRVDGYFTQPVGNGSIVFGLGFSARSGQPRNYVSNLGGNGQLVLLLPRGAGGRTPPVTQFDGKLSYRRPLTAKTALEAFVDVFNLFNQQAVLHTDDDYTYNSAAAIINGTKEDLKYAKNNQGGPLAVNPNYGRAMSYQAPIHGRLGLRLTF